MPLVNDGKDTLVASATGLRGRLIESPITRLFFSKMLQIISLFVLATSTMAAVSPDLCKIESIKNVEAEKKHEGVVGSVYSEIKVITCNAVVCLKGEMSLAVGQSEGSFRGTVNKDETKCMSHVLAEKTVLENLKETNTADLTIVFELTGMSKKVADEDKEDLCKRWRRLREERRVLRYG
jgi:hypothetical protein